MTSMTSEAGTTAALSGTVLVVLVGPVVPTAAALYAALGAQPGSVHAWEVLDTEAAGQGSTSSAEIALCDGAAGARTARANWPRATVVALVPAHDDGSATIAAMHAGAHLCVRGNDPALIAAYLKAITRRRGLRPERGAR